jgi:hypothetical protein
LAPENADLTRRLNLLAEKTKKSIDDGQRIHASGTVQQELLETTQIMNAQLVEQNRLLLEQLEVSVFGQ